MRRLSRLGALTASCVIALAAARDAGAQQYVTDDAAITELRACQLQMWHGQRSSWVLPVCTPVRNAELSAGLIRVHGADGESGHTEYVFQLKAILKPLVTDGYGIGFVLGTGRDPGLRRSGRAPSTNIYAYVPVTISVLRDRLLLHQNTGWVYDPRNGSGARSHAPTWAARGDFVIRPDRLVIVGESFGVGGSPSELQVGLRTWLKPNRVQLDLSYGRAFESGERGAGWTFGLALISPPFL